METYVFTFGVGHEREYTAVRITAPDYYKARAIMNRKFGLDWSNQYEESEYLSLCDENNQPPYPIKFEFEVKE